MEKTSKPKKGIYMSRICLHIVYVDSSTHMYTALNALNACVLQLSRPMFTIINANETVYQFTNGNNTKGP